MKIQIPDSIKLTNAQKGKVMDWAAKFPDPTGEPDCCGSSHFTWTIVTSGIGDSIVVRYGRDKSFGKNQELFVNEDEY